MRISFSPVHHDEPLILSRHGDILTINGDTLDLSSVPGGARLPADAINSQWIVGPVERIDGMLHVTLMLPYQGIPSPEIAFPEPIIIARDGPVSLPCNFEPETHDNDED